jgi:ubiquinone biosynthesis protein
VPEVHWDWCTPSVMVMERMHGMPISQIDALREKGVDIPRWPAPASRSSSPRCSATASSTPTCIRATSSSHRGPAQGRQYIALDFGIVGTLSDVDKNYLAQNFLAFFQRDYKRVAEAHIESGWVPKGTRVDEFEARSAPSASPSSTGR